jgi:hypothetical protein
VIPPVPPEAAAELHGPGSGGTGARSGGAAAPEPPATERAPAGSALAFQSSVLDQPNAGSRARMVVPCWKMIGAAVAFAASGADGRAGATCVVSPVGTNGPGSEKPLLAESQILPEVDGDVLLEAGGDSGVEAGATTPLTALGAAAVLRATLPTIAAVVRGSAPAVVVTDPRALPAAEPRTDRVAAATVLLAADTVEVTVPTGTAGGLTAGVLTGGDFGSDAAAAGTLGADGRVTGTEAGGTEDVAAGTLGADGVETGVAGRVVLVPTGGGVVVGTVGGVARALPAAISAIAAVVTAIVSARSSAAEIRTSTDALS